MVKVSIISPDAETRDTLASNLSEIAGDSILELRDYPTAVDIDRLVQAIRGHVLLLDFAEYSRAMGLAALLDRLTSEIKVIAVFLAEPSRETLAELMRLGVREVLFAPLHRPEVCATVMRIAQKDHISHASQKGNVYAFLPSKPGAGATTICIGVAAAIARLLNRRTLLLDFDLKLGVTSFLLQLHSDHSVVDALIQSQQIDDELWRKLIGQYGMLDVLGSAPSHVGQRVAACDFQAVLDHAQREYVTTCVDLPGGFEDYEIEVLRQATRIFLVTTADMSSLHVATRKTTHLKQLGVTTPIGVLLNFAGRRGSLSATDVEHVVQEPVLFSLPCDEKAVTEAATAGRPVSGRSALGRQIDEIAKYITAKPRPSESFSGVRRFVEYFSISSVRDVAGRR